MTCGFVFAFAVLGVPGTGWEVLCEPGDALKDSAGPSDLQLDPLGLPTSILSDLGCNFGGLETSFFDTNRTLDGVLSIHSFNVIIRIILLDLLSSREPPELEKP